MTRNENSVYQNGMSTEDFRMKYRTIYTITITYEFSNLLKEAILGRFMELKIVFSIWFRTNNRGCSWLCTF